MEQLAIIERDTQTLTMRPYQARSIEALREGFQGKKHRAQVLMAPTGAGKTVVACALMEAVAAKMTRAAFVVDRVSLVDQTSRQFDRYGIAHGVIQANHPRTRPWERIQVCSAQTLARRGFPDGLELLIVDECHAVSRAVVDFIKANPDVRVVGLSATPFTKGLGAIYSNLVNVTTQAQLIEEGFLCPIKAYAAVSPDMEGARLKFDGEWNDEDIHNRATAIIGDIVAEWIDKTNKHFGGPVKTIAFSADVAHGEDLCRQFNQAGYRFEQISYKDGSDERRKALIDEFAKPNSDIVGLVSCEALSKGFDVPDILCGIGARPYRKSLSSHIQQIGRVMRPSPGKTYALWLDHAGNYLRFLTDTEDIAVNGMRELNDKKALDSKPRAEPDKTDNENKCGGCSYIMPRGADICPMCGKVRPRRSTMVPQIDGHMIEVDGKALSKKDAWKSDKDAVWRQMVDYACNKYDCRTLVPGTHDEAEKLARAEKFAKANYRSLYDTWPRLAMRNVDPEPPSVELLKWFRHKNIAYINAIKKPKP